MATSRVYTTTPTTNSPARYVFEEDATVREKYDFLKSYVDNNGLYDVLYDTLKAIAANNQALRALRNPANRVVEFYAAKLWPGNLPDALSIRTDNEAIVAPIQQFWTWSNWAAAKQVAARQLAGYGDWFVKVVQKRDATGRPVAIYAQNIQPQCVTDIATDERGYLTAVRIDTPDADGSGYTVTEHYDKATGLYRSWTHKRSAEDDLDELGTPDEAIDMRSEWGIDYVPMVHVKCRDVGEARGNCAFWHALDKIDEANRMATRLHQMIFRYDKPLWAVEGAQMDAAGRPLPPPVVATATGDDATGRDITGQVDLSGDQMVSVAGRLQSLVPAINYDAVLATVNAMMIELERDLPELTYSRITEATGELSGRAIRYMLTGAIDRLTEVRGNAEAGLVRLNQMALTMGIWAGLFPATLGKYEKGDFDHDFEAREVVPLSDAEKAEQAAAWVGAGVPLPIALKRLGWSQEDIDELAAVQEAEEQRKATLAQAYFENAQRNFNAGGDVPRQDAEPQRGS